MLKYLLDTNTISEPARPSPNPRLMERLERNAEAVAIAAPVWHELLFGLRRLPPSAKRTRIEGYLFTSVVDLPILPYNDAAADWHADQRARLEAKGRVTSSSDGQIAAIAHVHNLIVVTANRTHFEPFEGLRIENWMD
ncbi:MAG TPA: type II toxin-antitoxin system VapC family toxin [Thermoanaerobaculia bacterium]|jgi:tRNA(fMet)-specific endonuclease VapC|nr:type II toxin-antitoxin system VapC family toxin [Thermoanaerobaculia bacterium]